MTDKAPERIWASYPEGWFTAFEAELTTEYVRADIHEEAALKFLASEGQSCDRIQALEAERDNLREALKDARDYVRDCASGGLQIVSRVYPPQCQETLVRIDAALGETEK